MKTLFFENAKLLAEKFDIVPLLYGSLGLEYITGQNLNADDIDILIPEIYLNECWNELLTVLINNGYVLFDEHEHTFIKNGVHYSYAYVEELETFAEINLNDIKILSNAGVLFKVLSFEQYLKVYTASSRDGYRINVRKKKDTEKILFIKNLLENQTYK